VFSRHQGAVLFSCALALYAVLILRHLESYPVYFFADEAIHGVDAYSIAHTGADHFGRRWPLFFEGLGEYPLSLSVYLQVPLIAAMGKSVAVVRTTTALLSIVGVWALYLTLRLGFRNELAWLAPLLIVASPFWYLHSRTGFEYVPATTFFFLYLYFMLRSLDGGRSHVFLAAASAAAAFYSYTPGRGWVVVATALSILLLAPTHHRMWRRWLLLCALLALFLTPYAMVQINHPEVALRRLEAAGYVDFRNLPIVEKLGHFARQYLRALDPTFWFTWNGTIHDGPMQRHVIPKLPLVPIWLAPFSLLGAVLCLVRIRRPESRVLLAFLLAVPVPASLLEITSHRCLPVGGIFVVLAIIGLAEVVSIVPGGRHVRQATAAGLGLLLAGYALAFDGYARNESIRRYSDYGYYGLQMGSPQLFQWIGQNRDRFARFWVSTDLFNMGDVFARFFLPEKDFAQVKMVQPSDIFRGELTWREGTVFAVTSGFQDDVRSSGCPLELQALYTVTDPLGRPIILTCFLGKGAAFGSWIDDQAKRRLLPVKENVTANGDTVTVEHPRFDIGSVADLFDKRPNSITRTQQVNPAHYVIGFTKARTLREVDVTFANTTEADVTVSTVDPGGEISWGRKHYSRRHGDSPALLFTSGSPAKCMTLNIEVKLTYQDEFGSVHLSGIAWR